MEAQEKRYELVCILGVERLKATVGKTAKMTFSVQDKLSIACECNSCRWRAKAYVQIPPATFEGSGDVNDIRQDDNERGTKKNAPYGLVGPVDIALETVSTPLPGRKSSDDVAEGLPSIAVLF